MPHLSLKNGLGIFYDQRLGNNALPTIVFVHGNSTQSESWIEVANSIFLKEYTTLIFDLPGHGRTDRSIQPEAQYTFKGYGDVLIELMQALGIKKAVFVGHSMGANILMQSAYKLEMAIGMCLMGVVPVSSLDVVPKAYCIGSEIGVLFQEIVSEQEADVYARYIFGKGSQKYVDKIKRWIVETDGKARAYMLAGLSDFKDECDIIEKVTYHVALICADKDTGINHDYLKYQFPKHYLWKGMVHYVNGAGHFLPLEKPDETAQLLLKYLTEIEHAKNSTL